MRDVVAVGWFVALASLASLGAGCSDPLPPISMTTDAALVPAPCGNLIVGCVMAWRHTPSDREVFLTVRRRGRAIDADAFFAAIEEKAKAEGHTAARTRTEAGLEAIVEELPVRIMGDAGLTLRASLVAPDRTAAFSLLTVVPPGDRAVGEAALQAAVASIRFGGVDDARNSQKSTAPKEESP